MGEVYFDSGALVKLYVQEADSERVIALVSQEEQVPFTKLHYLEIRNAIRAQYGRELISRDQCDRAVAALDEDIQATRLNYVKTDWETVYTKAEQLSASFTADILCRALDILHVAGALSIACTRFITGDKRQGALAAKVGLETILISTA